MYLFSNIGTVRFCFIFFYKRKFHWQCCGNATYKGAYCSVGLGLFPCYFAHAFTSPLPPSSAMWMGGARRNHASLPQPSAPTTSPPPSFFFPAALHFHGSFGPEIGPEHILQAPRRADIDRQGCLSPRYLSFGIQRLHRHLSRLLLEEKKERSESTHAPAWLDPGLTQRGLGLDVTASFILE